MKIQKRRGGGGRGPGHDWRTQAGEGLWRVVWIQRYGLNTPSGQRLPLPALFLPHREIFSFLHTEYSFSCIRAVTRFSLRLEHLFQKFYSSYKAPCGGHLFQKPASPELPLLLSLHLLRRGGDVLLAAFRNYCLQV